MGQDAVDAVALRGPVHEFKPGAVLLAQIMFPFILLVSLGAGLMVTRATAESSLGREFMGQVFGQRSALKVAAAFLGALFLTALFRAAGLGVAALAVDTPNRSANA